MKLGCIGDDFTGSSDLANTLAKGGLRVTQFTGVPDTAADATVEAGVVALKTRTMPVNEAVARTLAAADWLKAQGCEQFFFKYCSTFDSTPEGNIGPVIDALMSHLGAPCTIACPAFPATGRSVYQGHLFVNDRLLNESGLENHPLTPMTDADLRRWLTPQTRHKVGHVAAIDVLAGPSAIRAALKSEVDNERAVIVVDAIRDEDLLTIGEAIADWRLITGGSGIALGLPAHWRSAGSDADAARTWTGAQGRAVALSGSCSEMTRRQVEQHARKHPALAIDADALISGASTAADAVQWALAQPADTIPLIYTSAEPATVASAQQKHGKARIADTVEQFFSTTAQALVEQELPRLIVAGGETSGAVVEGLALDALNIGPEIAAGVPALKAADRPLWLTLKSGNFGHEDFFETAARVLGSDTP